MFLLVTESGKDFWPGFDARHPRDIDAFDRFYRIPLKNGDWLYSVVESGQVSDPGEVFIDAGEVQVDSGEHCADQLERNWE